MKQFLEKIYMWIYGKTGTFDNVFFSLPVVLAVMLVYWFVRRALHNHKFGTEYKNIRRCALLNEIIRLLFVGWIGGIVCLTLTPPYFWQGIWLNIINGENVFHDIWRFSYDPPKFMPIVLYYIIQGHLEWLFYSNSVITGLVVNVTLFVPLGLALPFVFKKTSLLKATLIGLSCTFLIELLQCFINNRDSNIDDIICNTLGTVIGYLLYLLIKRLFPRFTKKGKTSVNDLWIETRMPFNEAIKQKQDIE